MRLRVGLLLLRGFGQIRAVMGSALLERKGEVERLGRRLQGLVLRGRIRDLSRRLLRYVRVETLSC